MPPYVAETIAPCGRSAKVPVIGWLAAGVAVLLLLLHQSAPQVALNEVSPAAGAKARAFRDNSAGINFVVVQETSPPPATFADPPPARTRNDGSSFMIELE